MKPSTFIKWSLRCYFNYFTILFKWPPSMVMSISQHRFIKRPFTLLMASLYPKMVELPKEKIKLVVFIKMCRCGGGGEHEHSVDLDAESSKSLVQYVDFKYSSVLNARKPIELDKIIRSKFNTDKKACLESDTDDVQLLIKIQ